MNPYKNLNKDLKKFNKNYNKLRKSAIKHGDLDNKEGRAAMNMLDALDAVLDDFDQITKDLKNRSRPSK